MLGFEIEWGSVLQLVVLAVMLIAAWTGLRIIFKLTATLFRIGCALIAVVMALAFVATLLTM
jgi:uncharacterized membrane protein